MELFQRIQTADSLLNRIQDHLLRVINAIARKEIIDGRLIEVQLSPAPTRVEHKLGRVPRGWIVVNPIRGETFTEYQSPDERFLYISSLSSAVFTARIWVF